MMKKNEQAAGCTEVAHDLQHARVAPLVYVLVVISAASQIVVARPVSTSQGMP